MDGSDHQQRTRKRRGAATHLTSYRSTCISTLNLPFDASQTLQRAFGPDLDRAAVEALVVEGYRTAKLAIGEVARILGLETSIAGQAWLAERGVELNYSLEDLDADREALSKHFPEMTQ